MIEPYIAAKILGSETITDNYLFLISGPKSLILQKIIKSKAALFLLNENHQFTYLIFVTFL